MVFSKSPCETCTVTGDRSKIVAVYPPRGMYTREFTVSWDKWGNPHLRGVPWSARHRVEYDRGLHDHLYHEAYRYAQDLWRGSSG